MDMTTLLRYLELETDFHDFHVPATVRPYRNDLVYCEAYRNACLKTFNIRLIYGKFPKQSEGF